MYPMSTVDSIDSSDLDGTVIRENDLSLILPHYEEVLSSSL